MIEDKEYAQLANRVYNRTDENRTPVPAGWTELSWQRDTALSGFSAGVYKKGNEIVISYTGTNEAKAVDFLQANVPIGRGATSMQVNEAMRLYFETKAANPGATISFTGHSLGGGLASMMAVFFNTNAVIFDPAPFELGARNLESLAQYQVWAIANGFSDPAFSSYITTLGPADFAAREANVRSVALESEILGLLRAVSATIYGGIEKIVPIGSQTLMSGSTLSNLAARVELHSMTLLASMLSSESFATAIAGNSQSLAVFFDPNLYKRNPENSATANFLDKLYIAQVSNLAPLLDRFGDDLRRLGTDGMAAQGSILKALTVAAMDYYYLKEAIGATQFFTADNNGVHFRLSDIGADTTKLKSPNLLVNAARLYLDSAEQAVLSIATLREQDGWHIQSGTAGMIWAGGLDIARDVALGGAQTDILDGGGGADVLIGGAGLDFLTGGAGKDTLLGGVGDDVLNGGTGSDILMGGQGVDIYQFSAGFGQDTILDSDGSGRIRVGDTPLDGGNETFAGSGVWLSTDEQWRYVLQGTSGNNQSLFIYASTGNDRIFVENFQNGQLGITLNNAPAPTPTEQPNPTRIIMGDLKSLDTDPVADGVQTGGDDLGNILTLPGQAEADRSDMLFDSAGDDWLQGKGGADILYATRGGDDHLEGGAGNDYADGGSGRDTVDGGDGDDRLDGGAGNDILIGGADKDVIQGGDDDDRLYGNLEIAADVALAQGHTQIATQEKGDWLNGGNGDDVVIGGADNDALFGGTGDDVLIGGAGDDVLDGDDDYTADNAGWTVTAVSGNAFDSYLSPVQNNNTWTEYPGEGGSDVLYGGAGNDRMHGLWGNDLLFGDEGNDVMAGGEGDDLLFGGTGDDAMTGDSNLVTYEDGTPVAQGDDYLDGGDGNDDLYGEGGDDMLIGGAGNDMLFGDKDTDLTMMGDDTLDGGDGDDELHGSGGADYLLGGAGNDQLYGDSDDLPAELQGEDVLDGGDGDDVLVGAGGDDTLFGGAGKDNLQGGSGDDFLDGGAGDDRLMGGAGEDMLVGGDGDDILRGDADDDFLEGGAGNDIMQGSAGEDMLVGGDGNDGLQGGDNDDILQGGAGTDTLEGGNGDDTYIFNRGDGQDTLRDTAGTDTLAFGNGITPADIVFLRSGINLVLGLQGSEDYLVIPGWGNNAAARIEKIEFADGTVWDAAFISAQVLLTANLGSSGNDVMSAWTGENATTMQGGGGNDTYLVSSSTHVAQEGVDQGYDKVESSVDYTLGANLEQLTLTGNAVTGTGNDQDNFLLGNAVANVLSGGAGNDALSGMGGDDTLYGGDGTDSLQGGGGNDLLDGGAGDDALDGSAGNDVLLGGDGADTLHSGADDDYLGGGAGDDMMDGDTGNDVLVGGGGSDYLLGGSGEDTLEGGLGDDFLFGDSGNDTYVFSLGWGRDVIRDYDYGAGNTNTIRFDATVSAADIKVTRDEFHLYLSIASTGDQITLLDWFVHEEDRTDRVQFSDGTTWQQAYLSAVATTVLTGTEGDDYLSGTAGSDTIQGLDGNDTFVAWGGDDILDGGNGDDSLWGGDGNDILRGGAGADFLGGGEGSDIYLVGRGAGQDDIGDFDAEGDDMDIIRFDATVATGDIRVTRDDGRLYLNIDGTEDRIALNGWFSDDIFKRKQVEFADGTIWDAAMLDSLVTLSPSTGGRDLLYGTGDSESLNGFGGDDEIYGNGGDDILNGGTGNDFMAGGAGSDVYLFGRGSEFDGIYDFSDGSGSVDIIRINATVSAGDVRVTRDYENLFLTIVGTTDVICVSEWFNDDGFKAKRVEFADGTVWDAALLESLITVAPGTAGGDYIYGMDTSETLNGLGGEDELNGNGGDDTLDGGAGVDRLFGGAGNDVYLFGRGGGSDTVFNHDENPGYIDTVRFNGTVSAGDIRVTRDYSSIHLAINGTSDEIILDSWFEGDDYKVDRIEFADGTVWNPAMLESLVTLAPSTEGGDVLYGTEGADVLNGLGGYDGLYGAGGNDMLSGGADGDDLDGAGGADVLEGGAGDDYLNDNDGGNYYNGGSGVDNLQGSGSADFLIGGTGNDDIRGGDGADVIAFNVGDGKDFVFSSGDPESPNKTVSLGGAGLDYYSMSLQKVGSDLVLKISESDTLTFGYWYGGASYQNVLNLQVVAEAMAAFDSTSSNHLNNRKVQIFDFQGLVGAYDAARLSTPGLNSWGLINGLMQFRLSSSDTVALGGDLAYHYGVDGTLAGMGLGKAQEVFTSGQFGTQTQALHSTASLQEGLIRLG